MDSGRPLCVNSRRSTANVRTRAGANRGWGPIRCTWGNNKPDRTKTQQKISQVHGYKSRPISRNLAEISIAYVIGKREAPVSLSNVRKGPVGRRGTAQGHRRPSGRTLRGNRIVAEIAPFQRQVALLVRAPERQARGMALKRRGGDAPKSARLAQAVARLNSNAVLQAASSVICQLLGRIG